MVHTIAHLNTKQTFCWWQCCVKNSLPFPQLLWFQPQPVFSSNNSVLNKSNKAHDSISSWSRSLSRQVQFAWTDSPQVLGWQHSCCQLGFKGHIRGIRNKTHLIRCKIDGCWIFTGTHTSIAFNLAAKCPPSLPYFISRPLTLWFCTSKRNKFLVVSFQSFWFRCCCCFDSTLKSGVVIMLVPTGSPSRGGDVTVYVRHKPTKFAHSFLFCSFVYFCPYGPFNCISFYKVSWQLSIFSFCSSDPISALLVLSTIYLVMKVSFSPDIILCGWLDLKHQLTNSSWCLSKESAVCV